MRQLRWSRGEKLIGEARSAIVDQTTSKSVGRLHLIDPRTGSKSAVRNERVTDRVDSRRPEFAVRDKDIYGYGKLVSPHGLSLMQNARVRLLSESELGSAAFLQSRSPAKFFVADADGVTTDLIGISSNYPNAKVRTGKWLNEERLVVLVQWVANSPRDPHDAPEPDTSALIVWDIESGKITPVLLPSELASKYFQLHDVTASGQVVLQTSDPAAALVVLQLRSKPNSH